MVTTPRSNTPRRVASFAVFLALSLGVLGLGGWLTSAGRGDGWYESLRKPPFQLPDRAFGPAWTTLMTLTAVATWLVYESKDRGTGRRRLALTLYVVQLAMNLAWSYLFFFAHRPKAALVELIAFDLVIAATVAAYSRVDRLAAALLLPYLGWVIFATTLNGWIVANN